VTTALLNTSLSSEHDVPSQVRPIRVLHVIWSGELGGAERAVYQLVRAQRAHGHIDPAVMFAESGGPYVELARSLGSCEVHVLDLASNREVRRLREIARRMEGFDVHHFHSAEPLLMAASTRAQSPARVYTHRGGLYDYAVAKRLRFEVCGMLLRQSFHAFSGNTAHASRSAAALYRMRADRFRVTYNGIDFSLIEPVRPAGEVRGELGVVETDRVLGTAAVLKEWKRIDRLIRAVASLRMPGLHLVIVGDGPERRHLEALSNAIGVAGSVHFVGRQARPWDYFQVMDVFSLPSMGLESFGNAAVEAMALGLPTIVFADGGGLLEHVEHGRTGVVVETQQELARAISELMESPPRRQEIGANARSVVRQRYSTRRAADTYHGLYMEALRAASTGKT
jgi:glycosyltransferase involved in cell wall biosynthesis